jgi:serine/threonine-protein phosphatase CPPED1
MKRVLLLVAVAVPLVAAAVYSRQQPTGRPDGATTSEFKVTTEAKNPWTSLKPNADPDQFQFAVVTDRTGGHRAKVFSRAVQQINLLQPEFVMSVGDLIEGYSKDEAKVTAEWNEFDGYVKKFQMPFFYVPGNHDLTNKEQVEWWGGRYGRKYYHFVYKNVLFLAVNSEDPVSEVSAEQAAYFKRALDENPNVKWTLVFTHKPLWTANDLEKNGWAAVEKALAGRKYTVFCGHVHRYQKFVRNGMNYYQLATTGGGSRLRGLKFGEFDHVSWITMKKDGPLIANVLLDGVLPENLEVPDSEEKGVERKMLKTYPLSGTVTYKGQPLASATVRFYKKSTTKGRLWDYVADGLTAANGTLVVSTYTAFDGIPAGEYVVSVVATGGYDGGEAEAVNKLPAKYAKPETTPLKVVIKEGENKLNFELD